MTLSDRRRDEQPVTEPPIQLAPGHHVFWISEGNAPRYGIIVRMVPAGTHVVLPPGEGDIGAKRRRYRIGTSTRPRVLVRVFIDGLKHFFAPHAESVSRTAQRR